MSGLLGATPEFVCDEKACGVTVRDLELLHAGADTPFLRAALLKFEPAEWTLVLGNSGSGKTSLLKSMNGLWSHGCGVFVFPVLESLYAVQDVKLQVTSLANLVCLPELVDAFPPENIVAALRAADLAEFIQDLHNNGRDGRTWDGVLSGGQKQKLILARIILQRPGLLFLDEATSALDPNSVQAFYKAIKNSCPDTTVIAVTHDISPIQIPSAENLFDSVLAITGGIAHKTSLAAWQQQTIK
ncbi:ABC-type uncharacterized transport system fused permease/ATPase subunit [Rhizobium tibeticum]|uniref:ATP-binding cassette domain-containing protein n=1 Tax=Rhizobium tibeticum TaxID=501024 RepID=UPI002782DF61|nr:ATP-binding cassette domain-containing protein [Rhizobium tibeticum]MDP9812639.1 ABC-type uncharacterized transport system fused permease/ATPase subunit [Rhizobium tibeticum]